MKKGPSEADFQRRVVKLAHKTGHLVAHFTKSQSRSGQWRTSVAYDAAGFPDLVIVGPAGVLFRELKSERGKVSPAQQLWIDRLRGVGADAKVWRPSDWEEIEATLGGELE